MRSGCIADVDVCSALEQHADHHRGRHEQEVADAPADIDVLVIADVDEEIEERRDATASAPKIAEAARLAPQRRRSPARATISTGPKLSSVTHQKSCTRHAVDGRARRPSRC